MTVPPSQTAIANAAAALLGSTQRLNSITQTNVPLADHTRSVWDSMMRQMFADHPWNFAIERALLNASASAPAHGWDNAFTLPPQCLRWLPPAHGEDGWFEAVEEGGRLLTNAPAPLPVRFISAAMIDQIERWPAFFVTAVEYELAARLAEPITQSATLQDKFTELAQARLRQAKRRDGQASGNRNRGAVVRASAWQSARRGHTRHCR